MATAADTPLTHLAAFLGSAPVALLLTLLVSVRAFGPRIGRSLADVAASCRGAAQAMAMILLVIGAGGAFEQVLKEYFDLSVLDAIKARTTCTTVLAVLGLGGVLVMERVLDTLTA